MVEPYNSKRIFEANTQKRFLFLLYIGTQKNP